jgi:TldD protein
MVLSPLVAGVFAHESFGHKSEADFMVGDETMRREWALGADVGTSHLSIVDDGNEAGIGYTPFDDEGTPAHKTYLMRGGRLAGRLHSCSTAADLDEEPTGNARAVNFHFQPVVRMTTTYIEPGASSKEDLIAGVEDGLLITNLNHGSGMSTFTMAPTFAYRIRNGEVAEPVRVSVITGNVFETLGKIDGLSDHLKLHSFVRGGCGKSEQFPLPVGFGGPWVRVSELAAQ